MNIHNLSPVEALKEESFEYYDKGMQFLSGELVFLNVNIFIIDKIIKFRFDLFSARDQWFFFRMVFRNFFYASLLIITKLAADQGGDLLTLPRFKNRVRQSIKPEYLDQLDDRLRQAKFDKKTQTLLEKARSLRTQKVAHAIEDFALGNEKETRVLYSELKELRDQLNELLDALSFNVHYMMLPIQYSPDINHPEGSDPRPDIERILDAIAKSSILLNMPEEHPDRWQYRRKHLKEDDIQVINTYRQNFGLEQID